MIAKILALVPPEPDTA